jgi:hypothetical protein
MPFCRDRVENPQNPGGDSSAILASRELAWIANNIRDPRLRSLVLKEEEKMDIHEYDARPDANVREFLWFANDDIEHSFETLDKYMRVYSWWTPRLLKETHERLADANYRVQTYKKVNQVKI